jgi:hypothetical protein
MDNFKLKKVIFKNFYYEEMIKKANKDNKNKIHLHILFNIIKNLLQKNITKYDIKDIIENKLITIFPITEADLNLTTPEDYTDMAFIVSFDKSLSRQIYSDLCYLTLIESKFEYKNELYFITNNFPLKHTDDKFRYYIILRKY